MINISKVKDKYFFDFRGADRC